MLSEEKDLMHVYQQWSIPETLLYFQLVEQNLKTVLQLFHDIVKIRTEGVFSYKYPQGSINEAAMGRLIEMIRIFNDEEELVHLLKSVKKDRDHLAHKGYLLFLNEGKNNFLVQKEISKVTNMTNKARVALAKLKSLEEQLQLHIKSI
jgi:hypothetical protein